MQPLHVDEIAISTDLVRRLVDEAFPQYSGLPVRPLPASGSDNALFRLGDELLVRLPRQPGGTRSIEKEQRWLPVLAPHLPVPVPEVVAIGEPEADYPERWSVVRWVHGQVPSVAEPAGAPPGSRSALAVDLATVLLSLRGQPVTAAALSDPALSWYRGEPLSGLDAQTRGDIHVCRSISGLGLDLDAVLGVWDDSMSLPEVDRTSGTSWYHGDLFAENLLVDGERLSGVLDFGGLGVGDPTVDLVAAWEVLDPTSREDFRSAVAVDDDTWRRGRAWALGLAVMTFPYYWETMPDRCAARLTVARAVLEDSQDD